MSELELIRNGSKYSQILLGLKKWRIIDQKSLYNYTSKGMHYRTFTRHIEKLIKWGFLCKERGSFKNNRIIYPTDKAISAIFDDSTYEMSAEHTYHNYLTTRLVGNLCKIDHFVNFEMLFDRKHSGKRQLMPDAVVRGVYNNLQFNMAIEVELHQKDRKVLAPKFKEYREDKVYQKVLYCFDQLSVFKSYYKLVSELDFPFDGVQNSEKVKLTDKFIFIFQPNLSMCTLEELLDSPSYHRGKESTLRKVFKL